MNLLFMSKLHAENFVIFFLSNTLIFFYTTAVLLSQSSIIQKVLRVWCNSTGMGLISKLTIFSRTIVFIPWHGS